MRRTVLAAVLVGFGVCPAARGHEPHVGAWQGAGVAVPFGVPAPFGIGEPPYVYPGKHGGYGRQLRGGFGVNGFAPWNGPMWGPRAFIYANGLAPDPRPHGAYVRPLGPPPEAIYVEGEPTHVQEQPVDEGATYRRTSSMRR